LTVSLALPLGVAKSTLINWSREHQHLIQNLRAIEWEDFADRTLASKQERLKALAEQLRRLDAELAQRDLALVSTTPNSGAFGCSLVLSGGLPAQLDHAPPPRVAFCFAGTSRPCPGRLGGALRVAWGESGFDAGRFFGFS